MDRHRLAYVVVAGVMLVLAILPDDAGAIPAFARKYRTSCTTCHQAMFPKLNPFGQAFRDNGYRIPVGDEKFIKEEPLPLGAKAWQQVWPRAVWPGEIPTIPPLVMRIRPEMRIRPHRAPAGARNLARTDFFFPQEVEFLMGGTMGDRFSFWGEFALFENGSIAAGDTERAFMQWDKIFGESWLNLLVGQYELRATPFSRFRKYTMADFITSAFRAVPNPAAPAGQVAFDFAQRQRGLELWGVRDGFGGKGGWEYGAGIVSGNGSPAAVGGVMDNNDEKDFYWRLSYKLGGAGVASGVPVREEALKMTDNWVDNSIRLGVSGYYGVAPYTFAGVTDNDANRFNRHTFDLNIFWGNLNLFGAFLITRDRIRDFQGVTFRRGIDAIAWFVEADYVFFPWLTGALRYDVTNTPDDPLTAPGTVFRRVNLKRLIPSIQVSVRPNIRIVTELELNLDRGGGSRNFYRSRLDFLF